uniref:carbon-nitrogen hydrolase family protein n=1 Tax=Microbulbifer agarilyticus TaxID=260552 RepID=UPI000255BB00|nr:carbon-nitrogen hydrolase family protein [Microbulbifer agarilyticus]
MDNVSVAAIQMVSGDDVGHNLARARLLIQQAAAQGARLALLPENFAHLADRGSFAVAETYAADTAPDPQTQPIQAALRRYARDFGIWLAAGAIPLRSRPDGTPTAAKRCRSAFLLFDEQGNERARYDKIHLFDVDVDDAAGSYRESNSIEPGEGLYVQETPFGHLGLSICFDLRFPELYRQLAIAGAEIFMVPAAFTYTTGQAHWQTLLRARAIENGCFVIAANQGGAHSSKRRTWGHSMIIDPWGDVLAEADEGEAVIIADLHGKKLEKVRKSMPLLSMRRL